MRVHAIDCRSALHRLHHVLVHALHSFGARSHRTCIGVPSCCLRIGNAKLGFDVGEAPLHSRAVVHHHGPTHHPLHASAHASHAHHALHALALLPGAHHRHLGLA